MNLITLENIYKSYSEKELLVDISLGINEGDKIGIIGLNGAGKSTLLKIINGKDEFFDGKITKSKGLRIESLEQDPIFDENLTVIEQIFKGDTKEMKLLMEYEDLLSKSDSIGLNEDLNNKLIRLQADIDNLNLWALESEAKSILNKLGIDNYNEKMINLSGGQKKRVFLASSLITPCDLLVLDEPTNHLDASSIEWLEEYLNNRKGALIMITHDRYFLDRVVNKILEIDRGSLYQYIGNYSDFLEKKIERIEIEKSSESKRQSLIRKELKWVKRGAKARTTKQKARLQRFDDLVNTEYKDVNGDIEIPYIGRRLGKKTIEIVNLSKRFENTPLFHGFNYTFLKEDKIGIIGNNGAGKSTLLNILCGNIEASEGIIEYGDTIKIGSFTQHFNEIDPNIKAIDYIREGGEVLETLQGEKITASTLCENFLFDGVMQHTLVSKLSGGEKRRLQLLRVLMESPNFLVFDEPTNDLDIETLKILEDFLDKFIGIVVVVSHDRYFLDRVCNKIFAYEDGTINIYNGNFSDYEIKKLQNIISNEVSQDNASVAEKHDYKKKRKEKPKFTFKELKEYETIDNDILNTENEINVISLEMNNNSSDFGKLNELLKEKEALEAKLEHQYERWEYLNELKSKIDDYNN
ncbi:MAG: ABC-F family ATP-binding cassette domain-containing protein [Clostridium sp.]